MSFIEYVRRSVQERRAGFLQSVIFCGPPLPFSFTGSFEYREWLTLPVAWRLLVQLGFPMTRAMEPLHRLSWRQDDESTEHVDFAAAAKHPVPRPACFQNMDAHRERCLERIEH